MFHLKFEMYKIPHAIKLQPLKLQQTGWTS